MAAAANIQASQAFVLGAIEGGGGNMLVSQAFTLAVINYPAANVLASQAFVTVPILANTTVLASQAFVVAVVRGRVANHHLRLWTFTLDGHDFLVIRPGEFSNLVYDFSTQQWQVWGDGSGDYWSAKTGINWQDGNALAGGYGSNVVVCDDTTGALYFLNPLSPYDDGNTADQPAVAFDRVAMGQVPLRGRDYVPCYGVLLTGSAGDVFDDSLTAVTLEISDDAGRTYDDCGTLNVTVDDTGARVEWPSLGSMKAPGRLFKLTDAGAFTRIDGLEMVDDATS